MVKKLLIALIITLTLSGCGGEDKQVESKQVEDKIIKEAVRFAKEVDNKKFIPDHIEYSDVIGGGSCDVYGYYEDEPKKEITVGVIFDEDENRYEGTTIGSN
ncbi:hypothetical protein [Bacillus massilinigeriensis]|uniref:hypothetical protein n=1 Tax=Bacillus mediterraneensis TaxID=1805474 RepID=UPI0008F875FC|nr:hypothetical protein [Bacillus mediterraneensis]